MDKIFVEGGRPLKGQVRISGAKNAALPILVSSLLVEGANTYSNVPDLKDIESIKLLLCNLGARAEERAQGRCRFDSAYTSGLVRARDTAHFLLGHSGNGEAPVIADADTGHGGDAHVRNLIRRFAEVGVPGYHIEDQKPGVKKCGHQAGKVTVPHEDFISKINAIRYAREGFPVTQVVADAMADNLERFEAEMGDITEFDNFRATFMVYEIVLAIRRAAAELREGRHED